MWTTSSRPASAAARTRAALSSTRKPYKTKDRNHKQMFDDVLASNHILYYYIIACNIIHTQISIYLYMYVCVCIYIYIYTHISLFLSLSLYIYIYIYTHSLLGPSRVWLTWFQPGVRMAVKRPAPGAAEDLCRDIV